MTRRTISGQSGFTLIEIMVVVVIIGLLAALVATQVGGRVEQARATKAKQDISAYEAALTLYKLDNFRFPTTEQGLAALAQRPADPSLTNWNPEGYVKRISKDPWNRDYRYESPGAHGPFDLYTLGADGTAGGEGADADVGNWDSGQ
jgi:general secretion pathway protein G